MGRIKATIQISQTTNNSGGPVQTRPLVKIYISGKLTDDVKTENSELNCPDMSNNK